MRSLLYIVLLLTFAACTCGGKYGADTLDRAQALMHSDPKSALDRLNECDVALFDDSASVARWALLYSEALVANNISAPSDSIVGIAIDYYGRHGYTEEFRHASRLKALLSGGNNDTLASALYLQKEKEFLLYRERARRNNIILAALCALVIGAAVIIGQRYRLRTRNLENELLLSEASQLRQSLLMDRERLSLLESKLGESLDGRFNIIDGLCSTYYESQGTKTEKKALADKVKAHIEEIKADNGIYAEMVRCVNDCHNNLLIRFGEEFPTMKSDDYKLMTFLACRLSNRTIALLLGESIEVIYKRKSRLKARISASESSARDLFLSVF